MVLNYSDEKPILVDPKLIKTKKSPFYEGILKKHRKNI